MPNFTLSRGTPANVSMLSIDQPPRFRIFSSIVTMDYCKTTMLLCEIHYVLVYPHQGIAVSILLYFYFRSDSFIEVING